MAGAKKPEPIEIEGANGKIYVVETWNRGTIADGDAMTEYTIRPICDAIKGGTGGIAAETERAMAAESGISAIVDKHYDEYNTFVSNVNNSAESLSARLAQEISDREEGDAQEISYRTSGDAKLQEQIDTLKAATDVIMVYGDYQTFTSNSGDLVLTDADVIKVLVDENKNDEQVYYQWYDPQSGHEWSNWSAIGSLNPYYSKSDLNNAGGKNINITSENNEIKINTNDNVVFSSVTSNEFSGTNISALNFYMPSANNGSRYTCEVSSNSTGISAHTVDSMSNKVVTAYWESIINAANDVNAYVPLSAEECTIGNNNSSYDDSFAQGANNNANNNSLAQGYNNEAISNSFAQGYLNVASSRSLAQGSNNSAYSYSLAQGYLNVASSNSLAQGFNNSARANSVAFGYASQAYNGGFAFSPYAQAANSLASANSFAFGIGCTADTNAFAMGVNCSAVTGGFAYGTNCIAATNSIAMGAGMVSKENQISLGLYGKELTGTSDKSVFHIGYGQGSAVSARRDIFNVTYDGYIMSYNYSVYPQSAEVILNGDFFQSPRYGRKIPMLLSQGLDMVSGVNISAKKPSHFRARHNVLYGSYDYFNMWIPYSTTSHTSQEFTLTKADGKGTGMYYLTVGVDKHYSILFKHFNDASIKTGIDVPGYSWPEGGSITTYTYDNFFLDKESATSNTYFSFSVPCDDIITFIVDGASQQFIMIKNHN